MKNRLRLISALIFLFAAQALATTPELRKLLIENKSFTGDLDKMIERRMIRVIVPYSRTLYFGDKGREEGITAENVRDFEIYINKKYAKELGNRPITVYIAPITRDKLLPELMTGLADIAAGDLTETKERLKVVDFVAPADQRPVNEIVVTGPSSPAIASIDDLAGKTVYVRKTSSYYESLKALNGRFKENGKPQIKITFVPDALEDEDMMEMVSAGLLGVIVVDDWVAGLWGAILPNVKLHPDVKLRERGRIGWAIRKKSPKLAAELMDYYTQCVKKQDFFGNRLKDYAKRIKQITNAGEASNMKRFEQMIELFKAYGAKYNFDPLMLAAQGYQESKLDQKARSHTGAIGVMQVMPATGASLKVGNIRILEPNIHAGAKYMDQLMAKYFSDAKFEESERPLFAFASYNAGPGNIAKMRELAQQRGLDPNKWFNNVEIVVAEKLGQQTTTYVRNIYKYYVSYKLALDAMQASQKAREKALKGL